MFINFNKYINTSVSLFEIILFKKESRVPNIEIFFKKNKFIILEKFKKNKNLFFNKNDNFLISLISMLFKKGKKTKFIIYLIKSLNMFYDSNNVFNNFRYFFKQDDFFNVFNLLENNIVPNLFLFSFTSVKLDKTRKKNSRGKLPHIFFLWKYIPLYKRKQVFLKLLSKEIKFIKLVGIKSKFKHFISLLNENNFYYISHYQNFINSLIFKKYMLNLFENYKTKK